MSDNPIYDDLPSGDYDHPLFAKPGVVISRREICLACEHRAPILKICKLCGCVIVAKTKLRDTKCPDGKW